MDTTTASPAEWTDENGDWDVYDAFDNGCGITGFALRRLPDGAIEVSAELDDYSPCSWHIGWRLGVDDYVRWRETRLGFADAEADRWADDCEAFLLDRIQKRYGFDYVVPCGDFGAGFQTSAVLPPERRSWTALDSTTARDRAFDAMRERFLDYVNESGPGTFSRPYPYGAWIDEFLAGHPLPLVLRRLRSAAVGA